MGYASLMPSNIAQGKKHSARDISHQQRIGDSRVVLTQLRSQTRTELEIIKQMQNIDPYLFEELILTALGDLGYTIIRNPRYSGDGGIDGRALINGMPFLIQAKRYRGTIAPADIRAFCRQCIFTKCGGLFVHTGNTGRLSNAYATGGPVIVISGQNLASLLAGVRPNIDPFKQKLTLREWIKELFRSN